MAGRLVSLMAIAGMLAITDAAPAAVVDDTQPPTGAVGGVTGRAAGVMHLFVLGRDDGIGLSRAAAALDGLELDAGTFGDGACVEVPDADAGRGCPAVSTTTLDVPTAGFKDGDHVLTVTARDAAGKVGELVHQTVTVANTRPTTSRP